MFSRLKNSFIRFMTGRYGGMDDLGKFLFYSYLALAAANILIGSVIISILSTALVFYWFFRCFSKNLSARYAENNRFLSLKRKMQTKLKLFKNRWRDRKTHVYRNCPYCKSVVRLPKRKGEHKTCCPCCRREFGVRI